MPIQSVQGRRLYLQIADQLAGLIRDGEFPAGTRLPPERKLAELLGVSRTSVREALIALEIEGLVKVRVGSGVEVLAQSLEAVDKGGLPPHPRDRMMDDPDDSRLEVDADLSGEIDLADDIRREIPPFSILEARRLVEPEAAALAAVIASESQLLAINEAYQRNVADNLAGSRTHPGDRLFHIRIAEASGNPVYATLIRYLLGHKYGPLFRRLQDIYTPQDMPHRSEQGHRLIMDALMARNADAAREAMELHLDAVINDFMRA